jgi:hypothetical protein
MPTHGKIDPFVPNQDSWTSYIERLEHYFVANDTAAGKKKSVLLTVCGSATFELAKSLVQPETLADKSYEQIRDVLKAHYCPKPSPIVQRYRFNTRERHSGESIADYVAALRALGEHCNFGGTINDMIRDRLVCGVNDFAIQRRLLQENDLTYQTAYDLAVAMETASKGVQDLRKSNPFSGTNSTNHQVQHFHQPPATNPGGTVHFQCYRCGGKNHSSQVCRYKDTECRYCKKIGHLARVCNKKKAMQSAGAAKAHGKVHKRPPSVNTLKEVIPPPVSDVEEQEDSSSFPVYTMHHKSQPLEVTMNVNKNSVVMEVDTGAGLSLVSEETYSSFFQSCPLKQTSIQLHTYGGQPIRVLGEIDVTVDYQSQTANLPLLVVEGNGPSLLGRNWLSTIRLQWNDIFQLYATTPINGLLEKHNSIFRKELGLLKDAKATIYTSDQPIPRFCKPRSISYYLKEKVEQELTRLQQQGIITPVKHSTWAAPIVPVMKPDGNIRICGDYKVTINPIVKQDVYPLPRVEDLFSQLAGGKVFSKLDLQHAYQQIELDENSKTFTTINTHKGLFQYNRLPFGISSAPAIFQRTIETVLAGIPKIAIYLDDILVTGVDDTDHFQTLDNVLTRLNSAGLSLKQSKCKFGLTSIEYLGHIIDKDGIHPSPSKVEAIKDAPTPKNVTELKAFLGLINYYNKFMSNLSCVLSPLYRLLRKDSKWKWSKEQTQAFEKAKQLLQSSSVLTHFDPSKELIISADASAYGIGAVLSHKIDGDKEKPITFVSRTLTEAEKKYSQIEKEALAIIFAVKKFHPYIHGRSFCIQSDHKPLKFLFSENRQVPIMASSRIQRWALILGAYNYQISHKPGHLISNADALSRLPLTDTSDPSSTPEELTHLIHQLSESIVTANQIKLWTDKDPVLSRVRRLVSSGWTLTEPEPSLTPYHNRHCELSIIDGCVLWGSRVIVPPAGRKIILDQLHECHPGINRMKSLARCYVWWPKIDSDIENVVQSCKTCQENRASPNKAPLHPWEYPKKPWSRLHIDHAGPFLGHYFLIIVDAQSKWIEAKIVPSTSAEATITVLRSLFATHGIPEHIVSDNGPGFTSHEFSTFLTQNGVKHIRTSPYHPSSNGLAERAVQTVKQGITKLNGPIHSRLNRFLLNYRITPHTSTGQSPAEHF